MIASNRNGSASETCSLALLTGGRTCRTGEGGPVPEAVAAAAVESLLERLGGTFAHAFVVADEPRSFLSLRAPVVAHAATSPGPVAGVFSAVMASPTPYTLCLGCDLPPVAARLLQTLADRAHGYEIVVPREQGRLQPLCAVYSKATLRPLQAMIDAGESRIELLFDRVESCGVDVESLGATGADERPMGSAAPVHPGAIGFAPRVRDFMAEVQVPTVSFVGKKKCGKTTALEGVIRQLVQRGRRVAAVKHDTHGFAIDVPGTDSALLRAAGADVTLVSSPQNVAVMGTTDADLPLSELAKRIPQPVDVMLTEGFMRQPAPKLEISRAERSRELIAPADELVAVLADHEVGAPVPVLGLNEYVSVADVIEDLLASWPAFGSRGAADPSV